MLRRGAAKKFWVYVNAARTGCVPERSERPGPEVTCSGNVPITLIIMAFGATQPPTMYQALIRPSALQASWRGRAGECMYERVAVRGLLGPCSQVASRMQSIATRTNVAPCMQPHSEGLFKPHPYILTLDIRVASGRPARAQAAAARVARSTSTTSTTNNSTYR